MLRFALLCFCQRPLGCHSLGNAAVVVAVAIAVVVVFVTIDSFRRTVVLITAAVVVVVCALEEALEVVVVIADVCACVSAPEFGRWVEETLILALDVVLIFVVDVVVVFTWPCTSGNQPIPFARLKLTSRYRSRLPPRMKLAMAMQTKQTQTNLAIA
jgi:hypothetical protein